MRKRLKSNLCTLSIVAIILFLLKSYYISYESNVYLEFESVDEGLEYQIYFTESENESFTELKSVKYETLKHTDFEKHVINIGAIHYLQSMRIDVGSGENNIRLRNVKIADGKKEKIISSSKLMDTKNGFFSSAYSENKDVVVSTKEDDPFFSISMLNFTPKSTMKIDYFVLANIFFAS